MTCVVARVRASRGACAGRPHRARFRVGRATLRRSETGCAETGKGKRLGPRGTDERGPQRVSVCREKVWFFSGCRSFTPVLA
jgi:hypothetical protein